MKRIISSVISVGLVSAVAAAALSIGPASAFASEYEHVYCSQNLGVNGTCPPNGSSEYAHLELNLGDAGGQSHETCIDDYLTETGYTGAACMYYGGEVAYVETSGQYGYPRAWNGGSVEHFVYGEEYGYHTAGDVAKGTNQSPETAIGRVEPGLDTSAAVLAGSSIPVWVDPGSTNVCLVDAEKSRGEATVSVCGPKAAAERRGLALATENAAGQPVVLGLAPNGNTSVKVTDTDGASESIPVTNGVYEITSGTPSTVGLKEASGQETTRSVPVVTQPPVSAPALTSAP